MESLWRRLAASLLSLFIVTGLVSALLFRLKALWGWGPYLFCSHWGRRGWHRALWSVITWWSEMNGCHPGLTKPMEQFSQWSRGNSLRGLGSVDFCLYSGPILNMSSIEPIGDLVLLPTLSFRGRLPFLHSWDNREKPYGRVLKITVPGVRLPCITFTGLLWELNLCVCVYVSYYFNLV